MREVITMWRHTKMVVLVALTAGVYAAILVPLKGIPLIPGVTEIRPANVIPVVFSLLFGPRGTFPAASAAPPASTRGVNLLAKIDSACENACIRICPNCSIIVMHLHFATKSPRRRELLLLLRVFVPLWRI